MFLFDFNSIINYKSDEFFLSNIDKGQATTIVLIVAGVIEALLLLALFMNISKKAKSAKNRGEMARMFDNSPTNTPSFAYQDPAPAVDYSNDNSTQMDAYDNNMSSMDNSDMVVAPIADSGIPSMEYNQETTFNSDNLIENQMNDTLDVPSADMSYDNTDTSMNNEMYNQDFNNTYENNMVTDNSGFASLENLPEIIEDNSTDPAPTINELGSDPNEIVEPMNANQSMDMGTIPEMSYDTPVTDYNNVSEPSMDQSYENSNEDLNSQPVDMNYDTSVTDYNSVSVPSMDQPFDNSGEMPLETDFNTQPTDMSYDTPVEPYNDNLSNYDAPIDTSVDYNYNMNIDDTPAVPDMSYDMPMEQPMDYNNDLSMDTPVSDYNYDMPNVDDSDPNNY